MFNIPESERSILPFSFEQLPDNKVTYLCPFHPDNIYYLSSLGSLSGVKVVAVVLVVFGEKGFIVKTDWGILYSEGLLLGTSVVGHTKKWKPG